MACHASSPACLLLTLFLGLFAVSHVHATIFVPEEIPSLLSVIYSNLPPIKKGTDSKLGVGFRLGPNADVQFQLELGPQTNTVPVGATAGTNAQKRHADAALDARDKPKNWLNLWRLQMSPGYVQNDNDGSVNGGRPLAMGNNANDATSDTAMNAVMHLQQLYKPQPVAV